MSDDDFAITSAHCICILLLTHDVANLCAFFFKCFKDKSRESGDWYKSPKVDWLVVSDCFVIDLLWSLML